MVMRGAAPGALMQNIVHLQEEEEDLLGLPLPENRLFHQKKKQTLLPTYLISQNTPILPWPLDLLFFKPTTILMK